MIFKKKHPGSEAKGRPETEPAKSPPPAGRDLVVRFFISSTFQDMQEERDILVKKVFPQLRRQFLQQGLQIVVVDLRWGVTREEAERGEVVPLCLSQIDRCRPYFIGLLGRRYGWVPGQFPAELQAAYPWLEAHRDRSLTELEIIHGVLNRPESARRALFYFRDQDFIDLDHLEAPDPAEEAPADRARLDDLKGRIRRSGAAVAEEYFDYQDFASQAGSDIAEMLRQDFPEVELAHPLDIEGAAHNHRAAELQTVYIPRPEYYQRLDQHLAGDPGALAVVGAVGAGKSALLANYAQLRSRTRPEEFVLLGFSGIAEPNSLAAMLFRVSWELQRRFQLPGTVGRDLATLKAQFPSWLEEAARNGRLVLMLDGVDLYEDGGGPRGLDWIPDALPRSVHLIVSLNTAEGAEAAAARNLPRLSIEPLRPGERRALVEQLLGFHHKRLGAPQLEALAAAPAGADPLYLKTVVEELRQFGFHEKLDEFLLHLLAARDLPHLFDRVLARLEKDFGEVTLPAKNPAPTPLIRCLLSLIALSRSGIGEDEFLAWQRKWPGKPAYEPLKAAQTLCAEWAGHRQGRFFMANPTLRQAVMARYLSNQVRRAKIHRYLAEAFKDDLETDAQTRKQGLQSRLDEAGFARANHEMFYHLFHSGDLRLLIGTLMTPGLWDWLADDPGLPYHEYLAYFLQQESMFPGGPEEEKPLRILLARAAPDSPARSLLQRFLNDPELRERARAFLAAENAASREFHLLDREVARELQRRFAGNPVQLALQLTLASDRSEPDAPALLRFQALPLLRSGDTAGALALGRLALDSARREKNPETLLPALGFEAEARRAARDWAGEAAALAERRSLEEGMADRDLRWKITLAQLAVACKNRGDGAAAARAYADLEECLTRLGEADALANVRVDHGILLAENNDPAGAEALYLQAEETFSRIGDKTRLGIVVMDRGNLLTGRGQFAGALELYRQSGELLRQAGNRAALLVLLGNQGNLHCLQQDPEGATALAGELARTAGEADAAVFLAQIERMGNTLIRLGADPGARRIFDLALGWCRERQAAVQLQALLGRQAGVLQKLGLIDEALARLDERAQLCRSRQDAAGWRDALNDQGVLFFNRKEWDRALHCFQEAEQACRPEDGWEPLALVIQNQAAALENRGDSLAAAGLYGRQADLLSRHRADAALSDCLRNQARMLRAAGDPAGASRCLRRSADLSRALDQPEKLQLTAGLLASALNALGDRAGALEALTEKETVCRHLARSRDLVTALMGKGIVLRDLGNPPGARAAAQEARQLAAGPDLADLRPKIDAFLAGLPAS